MKVIGLGHYSRTGKDTFANALITSLREYDPKFRVGKVPFAWKLKQVCYELYAWAGMKPPEWYETAEGEKDRDIMLPAIGKTPVDIWIDMGTPAVRQNVYDRTWIDYVLKTDHKLDVLIVPDVRFYNEVDAVRELSGTLIKVVRPGYGPRKSPADRALLCYRGWDLVIGETGDIRELKQWANRFAYALTQDNVPHWPPFRYADENKAAYQVEVIEPWERDGEWLKPGWALRDGRLINLMEQAA